MSIPQSLYTPRTSYRNGLGDADVSVADVSFLHGGTGDTSNEAGGTERGPLKCGFPGCDKAYHRSEHLTRHQRTHEGIQPYKCDICQKAFSRQDVLVRHRRQHAGSGMPSERRASALSRAKKACKGCATAKLKCDGDTPCGRCRTSRKDCVYTDARRGTSPLASSPNYSPFDAAASTLEGLNDASEDVKYAGVGDFSFEHMIPMTSMAALTGLPNVGDPSVAYHTNHQHTTSGSGAGTYALAEGSMLNARSNSMGTESASLFLAALSNTMAVTDVQNGAAQSLERTLQTTINPLSGILGGTNGSAPQAALTTPGSATLSLSAPFGDMPNFDGALSGSADLSSMLFGNFFTEQSPQSQQLPASEVHGWDISSIFSSFTPSTSTATATAGLQPSFADDFYLKFIDETFVGAVPASTPGQSGNAKTPSRGVSTMNVPYTDVVGLISAPSQALNAVSHDANDQASAAMSGLLTLAAERAQQDRAADGASARGRRGHLPPLQHGLHTRPPSPVNAPEADPLWPTDWDPARPEQMPGHDSSGHMSDDENEMDQEQANPVVQHITEVGRLAILELLRFADLSMTEYHRTYVRLSRITLTTMNTYLNLYFKHIHAYLPWCHLPLFSETKVSGFLLAAMVATGASYAKTPAAQAIAALLGDIVHASVGNVVTANHTLAREIQMWQSLMLWSILRYSGVRRLMEITEAYRSTFLTGLTRMHVFDGSIPLPHECVSPSHTTESRWLYWKAWEGRKRTGFCAFLADSELTIFLGRSPYVPPRDLRAALPCSDALWAAENPQQWAAMLEQDDIRGSTSSACQIIEFRNSGYADLIKAARKSAFASTILVHIMHCSIWNMRQCGTFSEQVRRAMKADIRRALIAIGGGPNEFAVTMPSAPIRAGWNGFAILYHQAHMAVRLSFPSLLAVAGHFSKKAAVASQSELVAKLAASAQLRRELALHAGQCLRHIQASQIEGPYELFSLLFSGIVLYLYAMSVSAEDSAAGHTETHTAEHDFMANDGHDRSMQLDCAEITGLDIDWVHSESGGAIVGDIKLSPNTRFNVLHYCIRIFKTKKTWGLGTGLARIMQSIILREQALHTNQA